MLSNLTNSLDFKPYDIQKTPHQVMLDTSDTEYFKLNNLRNRRKQIEQKLKLISNRISFRQKKQQESLRRYIQSEDRSRTMNLTRNSKRLQMLIKNEVKQKQTFEGKKKAKEVESFRINKSRRLNKIYETLREKKHQEGDKVRLMKKIERQTRQISQRERLEQIQDKKQYMLFEKQLQQKKRNRLSLERKNMFERLMMQQAAEYQRLLKNYQKGAKNLKDEQQILLVKQQQAKKALENIQNNLDALNGNSA